MTHDKLKNMRMDLDIQRDVQEQLSWEPGLPKKRITATVKDGIVTLSGIVETYTQKLIAQKAAKKVRGVRIIIEDLHIELNPAHIHKDSAIASAVRQALKWNNLIPDKKISAHVENGMVKLEGEVEWDYQRVAAVLAVQHLEGIKAVFNAINLKHRTGGEEIRKKIIYALQRMASIEMDNIEVDEIGGKVTLKGVVRSFSEKEEAEKTAWQHPGVTFVDNRLEVQSTRTGD